jgi:putative acetyltransferase
LADGTALRSAQRAELDARYGSDSHEPGAVPAGDSITVFLVARDAAGAAVARRGRRILDANVITAP